MSRNSSVQEPLHHEAEEVFTVPERALFAVLWIALSAITYTISLGIFVVVWRRRAYHTAGYYLLVSLSVSDLTTLAFYMCFGLPLSLLYPDYQLDIGTVELVSVVKAATYTASMMHIFFIAINRYVAACHIARYKAIFTDTTVLTIILMSWVTGFANSICMRLFSSYYWQPTWLCFTFDERRVATTVYYYYTNIGIAFVMVVSEAFCYGNVLLKMKRSKRFREAAHTMEMIRVNGGKTVRLKPAINVTVPRLSRREFLLSLQFMVVTMIFCLALIFLTVQSFLGLSSVSRTTRKALIGINSTSWFLNYSINAFVYVAMDKTLRRHIQTVFC